MTNISKISVVGSAMAALLISTTNSWAPTAVETKVPTVSVQPKAPSSGNNMVPRKFQWGVGTATGGGNNGTLDNTIKSGWDRPFH